MTRAIADEITLMILRGIPSAALLLAALSASAAAQQPSSGPLSSVAWIAGCWERRAATTVAEEQWMRARGSIMLGMSRTTRGDSVVEYEQLRLQARDGRLVYHASPSGQRPTEFTSTVVSDTLAVFENLAHDFPHRVIYRRRGADSLVARIEGPGAGGTRTIDFRFARVPCPGPP